VVEILIEVAQAAHALHEAGVVHRDIKPGNVMLTAGAGTPVLMDLGLAQLADETEGRLTRTRQFVGTLRYASPEQVLAVGLLDRRSDVYSLGATLWELLTLRPLYGADDELPTPELMLKIQHADPESVRRHNPHVPRDLDAIVQKCLQKDRSRRYATAAELAADLGRFLRGEAVLAQPPSFSYLARKFARRYRWPLMTAAGVLLLLLGGTAAAFWQILEERNDAIQARGRADEEERKTREALKTSERNRRLAERRFGEKRQAMDSMLAQFSDRRLSGMPGTQPIRKVLFERGVELYEGIFREKRDDPAVVLGLADRYAELGRLQSEIGTLDEALRPLRKGEKVLRRLVRQQPANVEYRYRLGVILYQIGYCCWEHRKDEAGIPPMREAVAILTGLCRREPKNFDYALHLAQARTRLAALRTGRPEDRQGLNRQAYDSLKRLAARRPKDPRALTALARVTINRGFWAADRGKYQEAEKFFAEAHELARRSLEVDPGDQTTYTNLKFALMGLSRVYGNTKRVGKGIELLTGVVADLEKLAAANPAVLGYQQSLAWVHEDLRKLYERGGDYEKAVGSLGEVVRISEALAQRNPQNVQHTIDAVEASQVIADRYRYTKREAEAAVILDKVIKQARPSMRLHPTSDRLLEALVKVHQVRGELSFSIGQYEKAREAYQGGVDLFTRYRRSLESPGEETHYQYFLCCRGLLDIAREKKQTGLAIALAEKLIVPMKLGTFTDGDYKQQLLAALLALGRLYEDAGKPEGALRLQVRAMEEAKKMLKGNPKSDWWSYQLVFGGHQHLARLYRKTGDHRREFASLRDHLRETERYVLERDHSRLLAETADLTPRNLARLREALAAWLSGSGGRMKPFTIPTLLAHPHHHAAVFEVEVCRPRLPVAA
jgi:tetratricopeptide (TPR) repeat protein